MSVVHPTPVSAGGSPDQSREWLPFKVNMEFNQSDVDRHIRQFFSAWSPEQRAAYQITPMHLGQLGWITSKDKWIQQGTWAQVQMFNSNGDGSYSLFPVRWAPTKHLFIGRPQTLDSSLRIIGLVPTLAEIIKVKPSHSLWMTFCRTLYSEQYKQKESLVKAGFSGKDIDECSKDDHVLSILQAGMRRVGSLGIFSNGLPSGAALWGLKHHDHHTTAKHLIYLNIYRYVDEIGKWVYAYYPGKTKDLCARRADHKYAIEGDFPLTYCITHYEIARLFLRQHRGQWCTVVLTNIKPEDHSNPVSMLRIFEQTFVCALSTYSNRVLRPRSTKQLIDGSPAFVAATVMNTLVKKVAGKVGWNIDESVWGCTYSSPGTEAIYVGERTVWISRLEVRDHKPFKKVFSGFRSLQKLHTGAFLTSIYSGRKTAPARPGLHIHIPGYEGLTAGCNARMSIEVMMNGEPHAEGYGRLPAIGSFSDWNLARRVAVYVEWSTLDGKDHRAPLCTAATLEDYSTTRGGKHIKGTVESKHSVAGYINSMRIYEGFMGITYAKRLPSWKFEAEPLRVYDCLWDHLSQELKFTRAPIQKNHPMPFLLSYVDTGILMIQRYDTPATPLNIGDGRNTFSLLRTGVRKQCDCCYFMMQNTGLHPVCKPGRNSEGFFTCRACSTLRRECTFTEVKDQKAWGWTDLVPAARYTSVHTRVRVEPCFEDLLQSDLVEIEEVNDADVD